MNRPRKYNLVVIACLIATSFIRLSAFPNNNSFKTNNSSSNSRSCINTLVIGGVAGIIGLKLVHTFYKSYWRSVERKHNHACLNLLNQSHEFYDNHLEFLAQVATQTEQEKHALFEGRILQRNPQDAYLAYFHTPLQQHIRDLESHLASFTDNPVYRETRQALADRIAILKPLEKLTRQFSYIKRIAYLVPTLNSKYYAAIHVTQQYQQSHHHTYKTQLKDLIMGAYQDLYPFMAYANVIKNDLADLAFHNTQLPDDEPYYRASKNMVMTTVHNLESVLSLLTSCNEYRQELIRYEEQQREERRLQEKQRRHEEKMRLEQQRIALEAERVAIDSAHLVRAFRRNR